MKKFELNIDFKLDLIWVQKDIIDCIQKTDVFFLQKNKGTRIISNRLRSNNIKLIIPNEERFILIFGNLFWNNYDKKIIFEPQNSYNIENSNTDEMLKIERNYVYEILPQSKKIQILEELFSELENNKYLEIASKEEWKNFIDPYEYYCKLKEVKLLDNFYHYDELNEKIIKVIKVDISSEYYDKAKKHSFLVNDEATRSFILIKYDNLTSKIFHDEYLKDNTFLYTYKKNIINEGEELNTENEIRKISKIKKNIEKWTVIKNDGGLENREINLEIINYQMTRNKNKLEIENFYNDEIETEKGLINLENDQFRNYLYDLNKNRKFDDFDFKKRNFVNIDNFYNTCRLFKTKIDSIQKELNENSNKLRDKEKENALSVLKINSNKYIISLKELIEEIKNYINSSFQSYTENKNVINNKMKEITKYYITYPNDVIRDEEIANIELELKANEKYLDNRLNETKALNLISNYKSKSEMILKMFKIYSDLFEKIKTIKLIEFSYTMHIIFNFNKISKLGKEYKEINLNSLYIFNIGDYVLVKTIKEITSNIKRNIGLSNNLLLKIIGNKEFNEFNNENKIAIEDKIVEMLPEYNNLDETQKEAFILAIDNTDELAIIQGPPGTGKTELITAIIKYLVKQKKKVLISSQTNVAIENVLKKITSNDEIKNSFLSLWLTHKEKNVYGLGKINETWHKKIFSNLEHSENINDIKDEFNNAKSSLSTDDNVLSEIDLRHDINIFAATTTTSSTFGKNSDYIKDVDVLIIDEVSKCTLPEILRYALSVKKVIFVGDYKQLSPIFDLEKGEFKDKKIFDDEKFNNSKKTIEEGIFYDLFQSAKKKNRVVTLTNNYRSLPGVLDTYNNFYLEEGGLNKKRTFDYFPENYKFNNSNYFNEKHNFYFINNSNSKEEKIGTSRRNRKEVEIILNVLKDLKNNLINSDEKSIAIIFPYAAQINYFNKEFKKHKQEYIRHFKNGIEFDTVDSFQGSEADIVILSTVLTDHKNASNSFLTDFRRINVSLSRARDLLIICGNEKALKNIDIGGKHNEINRRKWFNFILNEKFNPYFYKLNEDNEGWEK